MNRYHTGSGRGRSCHDAIGRIFRLAIPKGTKRWIVDADIKGAFDNIDHQALLDQLKGFPARELIKQWLKAGVIDKGVFSDTDKGTPQGGVISPLLANIALTGMEQAIGVDYYEKKDHTIIRGNRALVRYADDFVIFTETEGDAKAALQDVANWLKGRGLEISEEKTQIRYISEGFDFLGFNIRQYPEGGSDKVKTLIKPSTEAIDRFKKRLRDEWSNFIGRPARDIWIRLNPILRGWGNYYRHVVSQETYEQLDSYIYGRTWRWLKRTHPTKSRSWLLKRYYGRLGIGRKNHWVFGDTQTGYHLMQLQWIPIERHILVRHGHSPDNPNQQAYWSKREKRKLQLLPTIRHKRLAKAQDGLCPLCQDWLYTGEKLHIHHKIPKSEGGTDEEANLALLHTTCHQQVHRRKDEVLQFA